MLYKWLNLQYSAQSTNYMRHGKIFRYTCFFIVLDFYDVTIMRYMYNNVYYNQNI